jgi:hypothetical protein
MVASRSGRRPAARSRAKGTAGAAKARKQRVTAAASPTAERDEIAERAARLGITVDRVLREYARIAFADLSRVLNWGPDGLVVKESGILDKAVTAAISEIAPAGPNKTQYRVKLYDKKAALDAIARHLGMFERGPARAEEGASTDLAEDAREVLARRLARLATGGAEAPPDRRTDGKAGGGADP